LLRPPEDARRFDFCLHSPTAHHATGQYRKTIPLPAPELCFGSWLGRWNLCCPTKIDESIKEVIAERLVVAASMAGGLLSDLWGGCPSV
jgi:CRISPR/Cas system endoribonuclease Cas6 (RAMP superfamily)